VPDVPEGRHNVAHRGSGGKARTPIPKPRQGRHTLAGLCRPYRRLTLYLTCPPTTSVVGYLVSSLRDWTGGSYSPPLTVGKKISLATPVGFCCCYAALPSRSQDHAEEATLLRLLF